MPQRKRVNRRKVERALCGIGAVTDTAAFKKRLSQQDFAALMKARKILYEMFEEDGKDDKFTFSMP
jgi:hypothetical protein